MAARNNKRSNNGHHPMKKTCSAVLVSALLIPVQVGNQLQAQAVPAAPPQLELRLALSSSVMHLGDSPPTLKIELHNKGKGRDFYSTSELIAALDAPAYVVIEAENENGKVFEEGQIHIESSLTYWNQIPPDHFFGVEYALSEPQFWTPPLAPGIYKLTATYISTGRETSSSYNANMTYKPWKGEIKSNVVSLRILPPHKKNNNRKTPFVSRVFHGAAGPE